MKSTILLLSVALGAGAALAACGSPASMNRAPTGGGTAPSLDGGADGGPSTSSDDPDPSFTQDELALLHTLSPDQLPAPAADASNRFADDPKAAALGQRFFFETRFAGKLLDGDNDGSANALGKKGEVGKVACAGCHLPQAGFLDNRTLGKQISLGAGWGRRRAPSLLDVGQAKVLMWDGRHDALYNQPFGPLESPVEMNSARLFVAEQIFALYGAAYEEVFGPLPPLDDTARFPKIAAEVAGCVPSTVDPTPTCNGQKHGMPGDGAEYDSLSMADQEAVTRVVVNLGKALGAYERLLSCGPGRFDAWMHGKADALTRSEQRGAEIFVGAGTCATCHSGPYLTDEKFHNVGLVPKTVAVVFLDADDHGAAQGVARSLTDPLNVSGAFSDGDDGRLTALAPATLEGAFRTPSLRCEARRPSFMHTGQLKSLESVVAFFDRGGDPAGYPGKNELAPLTLTQRQRDDLTAFLGTLEGSGPPAGLVTAPAASP